MKFNKNNLVDFNNEYRTIYFNHAELLGVDGVVSNVPILKGTLPPYCKTFYIKPHSEDKDLLTVLKKGDRSYGAEPEDIKMFITYQKIDISGNQVDISSSEFHIYKNISIDNPLFVRTWRKSSSWGNVFKHTSNSYAQWICNWYN